MNARDNSPSAEGFRARAGHRELPNCDDLRTAALLLAVVLLMRSTELRHAYNLKPLIQAGFAVTGYLLVGFLLRERVPATTGSPQGPSRAGFGSFLPTLPLFPVAGVVAAILYLPTVLSIDRVEPPSMAEIPILIDRLMRSTFSEFQQSSFEGTHLIAWPLAMLLVPRVALGVICLTFLGSGMMIEFSGLIAGSARPAAVLVAFSPLDLIAAGGLISAIFQGASRPANAMLARWAILMGLAMAAASISFLAEDALSIGGSMAFLKASAGFGGVNFILKLVATTMISALAWRDIGG